MTYVAFCQAAAVEIFVTHFLDRGYDRRPAWKKKWNVIQRLTSPSWQPIHHARM
jgi:hypothetical protein